MALAIAGHGDRCPCGRTGTLTARYFLPVFGAFSAFATFGAALRAALRRFMRAPCLILRRIFIRTCLLFERAMAGLYYTPSCGRHFFAVTRSSQRARRRSFVVIDALQALSASSNGGPT